MKYSWPTLYKKTHTGAIQYWDILVEMTEGNLDSSPDPKTIEFPQIVTIYGQLNTDSPQRTFDYIHEGKNQGKKNETTPYQQAIKEGHSKWESKKKEGYVESIEDAKNDKVDEIIEGGMEPMLAQSFSKQGDKITYPCFVQPKLDGVRCIAIKKGNEVTLWSRSRKRITSCPHIEASILEMYENIDVTLDGELYNHDLKSDFEKIISAVRTEKPTETSKLAQYHIYDFIPTVDLGFKERTDFLHKTIRYVDPNIVRVETYQVMDSDTLFHYFNAFRESGYEGAIARNANGRYEHKRSNHLQKIKEFDDADFEVVGVQEGKGKLMGNVGAFVCKTSSGTTFEAKPKGDQDSWKPYLTNESLWKGKKLVVQYQGLTGKNKVPRFPVGLRLKDGIEC